MSRYSGVSQENGLAEWTSKIKEIQRQVDADEEAEQRRLEEEIQASRLARNRRSRGLYAPRTSTELSPAETLPTVHDEVESSTDRQKVQSDALQKLVGASHTSRPEPISLAQFMGGRASGPRLNKQAVQDTFGGTQFESRSRVPDAPHPVFGKGGIAMPGMAKATSLPPASSSPEHKVRRLSSPVTEQPVRERSISPQKIGPRDRTLSTPTKTIRIIPEPTAIRPKTPTRTTSGSSQDSVSLAQFMGSRATGPRLNKHVVQDNYEDTQSANRLSDAPHPVFGKSGVAMPGMVKAASLPPASSSLEHQPRRLSSPVREQPVRERSISPQKNSPRDRTLSTPVKSGYSTPEPAVTRAKTPVGSTNGSSSSSTQPTSISSTPSTTVSPKPLVKPPSLARSVQPDIRSTIKSPQISLSENPSPAFLKPPPQKDPTPSLSRLQGRGFVQNMVNVSKQRESSASPSLTPERPSVSAKKSVLDRWPQENTPPKPVTQPPILRKSFGIDSPSSPDRPKSPSTPITAQSVQQTPSPTTKSKSVDHPILRPQHTPGLGSATTLVLLNPTEDDFPTVDELGQINVATKLSSDFPVSKGKPLNHPTRERAKKPKKGDSKPRTAFQGPVENNLVSSSPAKTSFPLSLPHAETSLAASGEVTLLKDKWAMHGVRTASSAQALVEQPEPKTELVGRRALPGLAASTGGIRVPQSQFGPPPSPGGSTQPEPSEERKPHARQRIPSTGNRATVMDVALALSGQDTPVDPRPPGPAPSTLTPSPPLLGLSQQPAESLPVPEKASLSATTSPPIKTEIVAPPVSPKPAHLRPQPTSVSQAERRKSSYEKYSAIILPPLHEETTPVSSPAGTLSRSTGQGPSTQPGISTLSEVHIPLVDDDPVPAFDLARLLNAKRSLHTKPDLQSISVEVISITHSGNVTLTDDPHIFYDTQVLAIVHRSKSKASGLASTSVWAWYGKKARPQEAEQRKLQDIARRYSTPLVTVNQCFEPPDLVRVLGGELVIRQGTRAHWSSENTAMHLIRAQADIIFIDEHDLNIKNLCSGFSYCVTVLGNVYVWHGCGSLPSEQQAARRYAQRLGSNILELRQGEGDDEMFWMVLGDEGYAQANYWRWRGATAHPVSKVWQIDSKASQPIVELDYLVYSNAYIYVFYCVWELFVLVGSESRGNRKDIRLAISFAREVAQYVAPNRPFTPTVHVVILPSQLPLELRLHFREIDETILNNNESIPDHMNVLSVEEAENHLSRMRWEVVALKDRTMLPLGLDPSACQ